VIMATPRYLAKLFVVTVVAQATAVAIVLLTAIGYASLYGKESWPVLFPASLMAGLAETSILYGMLNVKRSAKSVLRLFGAVVVSWLLGLAAYLALDNVANLMHHQHSKVALVVGLVALYAMVWRLERGDASVVSRSARDCRLPSRG
jgi:hypothetical protein